MWLATAVGTFVGAVGTGLGGLIGVIGKPKIRTAGLGMAVASGIMVAVSLLELLPEAFVLSPVGTAAGLILGGVFAAAASLLLHSKEHERTQSDELRTAGMLVLIAIAVHNFPEGLAIGAALHGGRAGSLIVMMMLHDVPEGLAIGVPLRASGKPAWIVAVYALLSGLPTGAGAMLGSAIGVSDAMMALSLAFAAGAMLMVTAQDLVPLAKSMAGKSFIISLICGIVFGLLTILLI